MRNYWWIIVIVLVFCWSGCKNDTDTVGTETRDEGEDVVLATYKNGKITRPDIIKWMQAMHFGERRMSNVLHLEKKLNGHLRRFALEILTAQEAERAGYDQGPDFKEGIKYAKKDYLIKCLKKRLRDQAWFREEVVRARIIQLEVKDYVVLDGIKKVKLPEAELENEFRHKMDIARIVIGELDKGADFAELAREYSDHRSKRKGGDIGYIFRDMEYPVIAADAFDLKKGEYTKEPIRKRNGVYILKVEDRKVITNDNIDEKIPDENNARGLAMRLRVKAAIEFENDLAMADDAEAFFKKITSKDTKTVLFEINDRPFTIADFDKEMVDSGDKGQGNVLRERLGRQEALLLREAFKREINKAPEFIEGWKIIRRSTLADQYKKGVILSLARIDVTDDEIDTEYNKRMQKDDAKTLPRDSIVKLLKGRKRFEKKLKWEGELLAKNEFRIL